MTLIFLFFLGISTLLLKLFFEGHFPFADMAFVNKTHSSCRFELSCLRASLKTSSKGTQMPKEYTPIFPHEWEQYYKETWGNMQNEIEINTRREMMMERTWCSRLSSQRLSLSFQMPKTKEMLFCNLNPPQDLRDLLILLSRTLFSTSKEDISRFWRSLCAVPTSCMSLCQETQRRIFYEWMNCSQK